MEEIDHIRQYIKMLEDAIVDLTDGLSPMEIQRFTGLSVERCIELKTIGNELIKL